jgi:hypothetical protein
MNGGRTLGNRPIPSGSARLKAGTRPSPETARSVCMVLHPSPKKTPRNQQKLLTKGARRRRNPPQKKRGVREGAPGSETTMVMVNNVASPAAQEEIRHYRALGSICRQQAVLHPEASWIWLSQAEKWEDLAEVAVSSLAKQDDTVPIAA